jgi:hypothetical protein
MQEKALRVLVRGIIRETLETEAVEDSDLDEVGYKSLTQAQAKKRYEKLKEKYPKWKDRLKAFSWASDPEAALGGLRAKAKGQGRS